MAYSRAADANYEVLKNSVDTFNATIGNEKGIFVEEIFQGGYADIVPKLEMASQSGSMPAVALPAACAPPSCG